MPHRIGRAVRRGVVATSLIAMLIADGRTSAAFADAAVVIAVPAPLTGPHARLGLPIHTAAGIVIGDANAAATTGRPTVTLDLRDDACATTGSAAVAREIGRGVAVAVVGHPCAASRKDAAAQYAVAGKVFVSTSATASGPTRSGDRSSFALAAVHETVGSFIGAEIVARASADARVAVVRDRTALAVRIGSDIDAALRAAGQAPAIVETFGGGDKDFSAIARRLAAAGASKIAIIAFPAEAGLALRDLAATLPNARFYGADMLATGEFVAVAGAAVAERMRIALSATVEHLAARHAGVARLKARIERAGLPLTREAVYAAVGLEAVLSAMSRAASPEPAAVAAALRAPEGHATLLGPVRFGNDGRALLATWSWSRWRGERLLPDE